jgi:hypothetical protein
MAAYIYTRLVRDATKAGIDLTSHTKKAVTWLRSKYAEIGKNAVVPSKFINESENKRKRVKMGRMYMFLYDPKGKKELPYYDRFPLIFPVQFAPDGFYGLNLHYLPPILRAKLLDSLYELRVNTEKKDETTRLRLTYSLLSGAARFRLFAPCFKHYLYEHTRSSFIYVPPEEWDMTVFLPTEQFKKATKEKVWKDSRSKV